MRDLPKCERRGALTKTQIKGSESGGWAENKDSFSKVRKEEKGQRDSVGDGDAGRAYYLSDCIGASCSTVT